MSILKSIFVILVSLAFAISCQQEKSEKNENSPDINQPEGVSLIVLGNVQDGGSPHIAYKKSCCTDLFENPDSKRKVVSLGLIDMENQKNYIFEATPDFTEQIKNLKNASKSTKETPDGIFLTHAHIGHYTGLMFLGKEAMNADNVPVYAQPRMKQFLETNGPWSQLAKLNNIDLNETSAETNLKLTNSISIKPFEVPHRDEFSETVGYIISGPSKRALFIPDIDKWEKWDEDIIEAISKVDYAFIDGTFYDGDEINNRDISEIPHPFVIESMEKFKDLSSDEKAKIYFIHFNHTNPLLNKDSDASKTVILNGFSLAQFNDQFQL